MLDYEFAHCGAFLGFKCRVLAGGAKHNEIVHSAVYLIVKQVGECFEIYCFIGFEGGDKCHSHAFEVDLWHNRDIRFANLAIINFPSKKNVIKPSGLRFCLSW
jgi:hypothetical protein